jgi:hypothetical protein
VQDRRETARDKWQRENKTLRISKKTRHHGELNRKNSMRKNSTINAPTSRTAHRWSMSRKGKIGKSEETYEK